MENWIWRESNFKLKVIRNDLAGMLGMITPVNKNTFCADSNRENLNNFRGIGFFL